MLVTKDISSVVLRFREAARHNWNTYFHGMDDLMGPDVQDAFSQVEEGLFQAIVMSACGYPSNVRYRLRPLPFLLVTSCAELSSLTLQIGVPQNNSFAWDEPIRCDIGDNAKLEFIRFFDWNPYEQISMSLIQVHITRLDSRPEFVGARALVTDHEVRFLLAP